MRCRDRVNLLEALRQSRKEAKEDGTRVGSGLGLDVQPPLPDKISHPALPRQSSQVSLNYPELSKPLPSRLPPPLPQRPAAIPRGPDSPGMRSSSSLLTAQIGSPLPYSPPPTLSIPPSHSSRTPSPDKKGRMLTTLRTKDGKRPTKTARDLSGRRNGPPPASSKAAGLAWDIKPKTAQRLGMGERNASTLTVDSLRRPSLETDRVSRPVSSSMRPSPALGGDSFIQTRSSTASPPSKEYFSIGDRLQSEHVDRGRDDQRNGLPQIIRPGPTQSSIDSPSHSSSDSNTQKPKTANPTNDPHATKKLAIDFPSYMKEYPATAPSSRDIAKVQAMRAGRPAEPNVSNLPTRQRSPQRRRRPIPNSSSPMQAKKPYEQNTSSDSAGDDTSDSKGRTSRPGAAAPKRAYPKKAPLKKPTTPDSDEDPEPSIPLANMKWEDRLKYVKKHLPKGVDDNAAKNIFNEIVVQGDEVHWEDVAGLDIAKKALKEAVVYPFLRPDLFMGLREPARGMLLFGPPGTGKTMLARAVATESRSTFFAISASSLTSKWLGESEQLVRALFSLAKALAPSIIFVDEIDSLLSSRGGSTEHESTRRVKTEFLIQWSDLQRAAAGKQQSEKEILEGDPSRVLVLAATNCPWAIDEAARRRFVRRQYIPLPEAEVRESQLQTLLSHQKHSLNRKDIMVLVELTDGQSSFSPLFFSLLLPRQSILNSFVRQVSPAQT